MKLQLKILDLFVQLILISIVLFNIKNLFELHHIYLLGLLFGWQVLSSVLGYFFYSTSRFREIRKAYLIALIVALSILCIEVIVDFGGIFTLLLLMVIIIPFLIVMIMHALIATLLEVISTYRSLNMNSRHRWLNL